MPKLYIKMAAADAKTMAQRVEILGFIYRAKERKEQENVKLSVPELTIPEEKKIDKMTILSAAPIFAETISRVYTHGSVSAMFN